MEKKLIYKKINKCRICNSHNLKKILNLGKQPLANNLINNLKTKELKIPLEIVHCISCNQTQLSCDVNPKIMFEKYFWVTGTSKVAKQHAKDFYKFIKKNSKIRIKNVLEIASNDGTFLKEFKRIKENICIGVDPAKNISYQANKDGIKTYSSFFNKDFSKKIKKKYGNFDLIYARNVFPHVPKPQELLEGMKNCMQFNSLGVIEFHYANKIIQDTQYDSIYHEHYFYYSLNNLKNLLENYGFKIYHVEESPISGGSLIIFFSKTVYPESNKLKLFYKKEKKLNLNTIKTWKKFALKTANHRRKILKILKNKKNIIAYGASARSSTMLNFCKINFKKIRLICDMNKLKYSKYTPGSNILIKNPELINWKNENYVFILSWNFYDEIIKFLKLNNFRGTVLKPFPKIIENKI